MLIVVICLLMKEEYLSLKLKMKMLTFQFNFVSEVYLMDLELLSPEKYLSMEMSMIFKVTTILLLNLTY